jgi:hypothetical protein
MAPDSGSKVLAEGSVRNAFHCPCDEDSDPNAATGARLELKAREGAT